MILGRHLQELCATLARSHRVIVLEGCDGAGKTTVASHLAAYHGFAVIHSSRSPEGVDLSARHRAIIATPGRRALDRSFVSELVYGPERHGHSRLTHDQAVDLAHLVAGSNGVFVHLTADRDCILDRLRRRQDGEIWQLGQVQRIQEQYDRVFADLANHAMVVCHRTDRSP